MTTCIGCVPSPDGRKCWLAISAKYNRLLSRFSGWIDCTTESIVRTTWVVSVTIAVRDVCFEGEEMRHCEGIAHCSYDIYCFLNENILLPFSLVHFRPVLYPTEVLSAQHLQMILVDQVDLVAADR